MIVLDNGDAVRGIAEVASKLDFTVNGYVGTTATQLADGQIASTEGDLYASSANATVVTSITVVNTDSAARTFTLYLKPSGGTSRAITPVSLDLGVGYSFYTDGQRAVVIDTSGNIVSTVTVLAHDLGGASHAADTLANLNTKVSDGTLVDTASIVLKALFDANTILAATSDNTPAALSVAASRILGRKAAGNIAAMTVAELLTLIGVAAGADVTGSNPPQAHEASHVSGGSDDIDGALNPLAVALTTRGDILFHDASGLQRLAKGAATTVLTMGANDPAWAAGGAGATKELWAPIVQATELYVYENFWPTARCNGTNDAAFVCFKVPHDFSSITSAEMLLFGAVTQASANIDVHSHYCADGEAFNTHSETDTASTYGITANQLDAHDISGILSSLSADDYVGLKIELKDSGHGFNALGFRLRYS